MYSNIKTCIIPVKQIFIFFLTDIVEQAKSSMASMKHSYEASLRTVTEDKQELAEKWKKASSEVTHTLNKVCYDQF